MPGGGQAAGAPFPFAALTREILTAASGRGLGDADFAALIEVLEAEAGAPARCAESPTHQNLKLCRCSHVKTREFAGTFGDFREVSRRIMLSGCRRRLHARTGYP